MVVIVVCEYLEKISEGFKVILKDREDFIRLVMIIFGFKMQELVIVYKFCFKDIFVNQLYII